MHNAYSDAAFALLSAHREQKVNLTRKAGQFLGQLVTEPGTLSTAQADWLYKLLLSAKLPTSIVEGAE